MTVYRSRQLADFELWRECRAIKRDRSYSRKTRKAARRAGFGMWARIQAGWHGPPNKRAKILSLGFRYGRYGGVGHGIPAGEYREPIDRLDRAFLKHDRAYATARQLCAWRDAQV